MAERPIVFSGDSVRAILEGRKTQTRRIVREDAGNRGKPVGDHVRYWRPGEEDPTRWCGCDGLGSLGWVRCPYGVVGDLLWVREALQRYGAGTAQYVATMTAVDGRLSPHGADLSGRAMWWLGERKKASPIFMPRWASRITLEVTEVRVQRLQEISIEDAIAEGLSPIRTAVAEAWDAINAKRAPWSSNPWVWAVSFEVARG